MAKRNGLIMAAILLIIFLFSFTAQAGPIHDAAEKGDLAKIEELLKANPNLINDRDKNGATPLHTALVNGSIKSAELLVARGADVNAKDKDGIVPLHLAVATGSKEIVKLLLDKGSLVNVWCIVRGRTPLHAAAIRNFTDIAKMLLKMDADVNIRDRKGKTALDYAKENNNKELIDLLKSKEKVTPRPCT